MLLQDGGQPNSRVKAMLDYEIERRGSYLGPPHSYIDSRPENTVYYTEQLGVQFLLILFGLV
jgi:hypothetical protein